MKKIIFILFIAISNLAHSDDITQSSTGDKSPVINTQGNVNITYKDDNQKREIYKVLTSLDKVEHLLPIDINLQECLESKRESLLKIEEIPERIHAEGTNFSRCLLRMKQEFKSPEWMIRQHFPLLAELSEKEPEIVKLIDEVIFKIREMQNNQHQHEIWLVLGCSNEIKYVKDLVIEKYEGTCILGIEDFDMYKDRIERRTSGKIEQKPNDILAQVGSTAYKDVNMRVAVVPKDQEVSKIGKVTGYDTMVEQTVYFNEKVFQDMEKDLSKLRSILSSFVEK